MDERLRLFLFLITFSVTHTVAQKKISTVALSEQTANVAIDRPGDVYLISKSNQILKFDTNGKLLSVYKNQASPTLFDPRDGARLFAYFREDQHYVFMNPAFDITASYSIDSSAAIEPWLACISGDHNLWLMDAADLTIKRVNTKVGAVEVDTAIPKDLSTPAASYTQMREYQGFLFLLNKERGILIFNSMGKWLKTVGAPGLRQFNFLGEELYFLQDDRLVFFNLFTTESRRMSLPQPTDFVLITDERIFAIKDQVLTVYSP